LKTPEDLPVAISIGQTLITNSNWFIRRTFVRTIGAIFGPFSDADQRSVFVQWLQTAASDPEEDIRMAACAQIGHFNLNLRSVIEQLRRDVSVAVRQALLQSITRYHDTEFVKEVLLGFLRDQAEVALEALKALKELNAGGEVFTETIVTFLSSGATYRDRKALVDALPALQVNSTDIIERLFYDDAIVVRYGLVDILDQIDLAGADLIGLLTRASQSEDYQLRQTAIVAIAKLNLWTQLTVAPLVEKFARDPVDCVRLALANRLPKESRALIALLKRDSDPDVRDMLGDG
jgi:hypothetical protein